MIKFGFALSSEEIHPENLIGNAAFAESYGFDFVSISDHISPWINNQGYSSFVWTVLGGIAQVTCRLEVIVGVTCPIIRYSPVIIAQAAATCGILMENRFWLGLGTGENLNEHVAAKRWPHIDTRREMLEEAIELIKELWKGDYVSYTGKYFETEKAKIYSLPKILPKIAISAYGTKSANLAGRLSDGLITTDCSYDLVKVFDKYGGLEKPKIIQINACFAQSEEEAKSTVSKYWPLGALHGPLMSELRVPEYFEEALKGARVDDMVKDIACGPNPKVHLKNIQKCVDSGFNYLYIHQIGPNQKEAIEFYSNEVIPRVKPISVLNN